MLLKLSVTNFALIDSLELEPGKGLNIITGETGAGKSILLGALSLILGQRADLDTLLDTSRKCIIEGMFDFPKSNKSVDALFEREDLDRGKHIFLRREISPEGKSRAFINDTPVNLAVMKELGNSLVDIHSQHETLLLNSSGFQLSVTDAFAQHAGLLESYKNIFKEFSTARQQLDSLREESNRSAAEKDFLLFQLDEINQQDLKKNEQEQLETEQETLTHSGEIMSGLAQISRPGEERGPAALEQTTQMLLQLQALSAYHPAIRELAERTKSVQVELKDILAEVEQLGASIQSDPGRLEWVNERLDVIYKLEHKHRVNTLEELINVRDEIRRRLDTIENNSDQVLQLEKKVAQLNADARAMAQKISEGRLKTVPEIEQNVKRLLKEVGMPHAALKIECERLEDPGPSGIDKVRFLFSANKGVDFADISKVASGGELSRLMLALKSSVARLMDLPTIIFDEIDTGVSGETAIRIGNVMKGMSGNHQLIAITHLPQIASRGTAHFSVFKEIIGKKTFSRVKALTPDERVVEIARMLSGDKPTAVAMENARELLEYH